MSEIVQGRISDFAEDGGVTIRAAVPSIDRAILRKYDKVLVEFADGRRISPEQRKKAHSLISEIAEWAGYLPEEMTGDGIHLYGSGYKEFALWLMDACGYLGIP